MKRIVFIALVAAAASLTLPAAAWAHAALLQTTPVASRIVNTPPKQVVLRYSEPVEPRFAVVSVTNAAGEKQTAGAPSRSPANADTLVIPLKKLAEGWYLVYWRVISVDGHPVRGAFTFAVGPNAGPAPQFVIPSTSETAATPRLVTARWVAFLSLMAAIGLFILRIVVARPVVARVPGTRLRSVTIAFGVASSIALLAIPVYLLLSTAEFALRSFWSFGALFPLIRVSAFGRSWRDLELVFALFVGAAAVAIWLDRPERRQRSIAGVIALVGAVGAAAAALLVPGLAGHAAQTSPRALSLAFDWFHLVAGSVWLGGLIGLVVLAATLPPPRRVAGLAVCVPRFSNVAFASVIVLIAAGTGSAVQHMPTLASFWQTSYGKALLVKIGLLAAALLLASVNLLRTVPRFKASTARPELGVSAASLLRRLVTGESLLVTGAVLAAAVLTSLPPPSKALASVGGARAHVGPGAVNKVVTQNGYKLAIRVSPNRAAVPNSFQVAISRGGKPVRNANVTVDFAMLDMEMGQQAY
ncbi:MAG TPA: copper resistance protein CopC, partial [Gaiellaceae bacterium]|nr:copper resistance protein CopC [Gaiellaceae bacterium]